MCSGRIWHPGEPQTQSGEARLQVKLSTQQSHFLERVEFLLGLRTLLVQFANKREANTGLKQKNKLKTTYTPSAAIMVDCISWGTKEQGVPMR